jgi:lipopolysaccharide export system permease protein
VERPVIPLFERYVFRRTAQAFLLTFGALIGVLWVTQFLRELDVVTAKGQAIWVFLLITVLALPAMLQAVAPIALLIGTIVTLNALTSDNELPVISAAGASRRAVARPVLLLAFFVMLLVALSYHVLAPASLAAMRGLLARVHASVIATLVQDGGFRTIEDRLTMHIREKAADGSFRDIFVSDDRDPTESLQYSAAQGTLIERTGGSFLVLQNGDLIREDRLKNENNVVAFETYALDLSQLGAPNAAALYKSKERSTFYLLDPDPDDPYQASHPERVAAELHDRMSAPLYTLAFAFIALAFLGRPRTNRQERSLAITAIVIICGLFRLAGFAAAVLVDATPAAIPFTYAIPLTAMGFGLYATLHDSRLRTPRIVEAIWDFIFRFGRRLFQRYLPQPSPEAEQP